MSLTEKIVRLAFPTLMASAAGRRLPSKIVPLLKGSVRDEFLAALKTVNLERLRAAEARGETRDLGAYPSFITVAGTSRCNIRCEFCINQWDAKPDGSNRPHMKPEHVEAIVDELFPYIRKLALSVSGEPLYDPHFELLVRKAGEYGVFVEFTTNAMLISKPGLLDLILDNVHRVNISFDGATPATYERLRGGSKFDKVCANVKLLTDGRRARGGRTPEFNMRYILMKDTIDELPLMVDLAKDLGVDHLFTNHLQVFMDELADQSLVNHKQRTNRMLAEARARAAARGIVVVLPDDFDLSQPAHEQPATATAVLEPPSTGVDAHTASLGPDDEGTGDTWAASGAVARSVHRPKSLPKSAYEGHCPYIFDQAFFEADGSIFPCCNSGGVSLGHLDHADDFHAIWTGDAYAQMRATMNTPQCHDICVNCYLREGARPSEAYIRPVEGAAKGGW
ncbi:MAG: radical SAM protein [Planctomycetes bacterium]|nr:radical SAM protein [Planctomycetota bacterium]